MGVDNYELSRKLERLIDGKDGLIFTKEVEEAGIPRQYLNTLVKENK